MSKRQLYTLEFPVRCSPIILWDFLSTPAGLQEWFADKVDEWEGVYSFSWGGNTPDKAAIVDSDEDVFIRYRWLHFEKMSILSLGLNNLKFLIKRFLLLMILLKSKILKTKVNFGNIRLKNCFTD